MYCHYMECLEDVIEVQATGQLRLPSQDLSSTADVEFRVPSSQAVQELSMMDGLSSELEFLGTLV